LFEEEEYWTKREIMMRTDQADKLVNDVLKELTVAETSGPNKNKYKLREEFKIMSSNKKQKL
jgi:hypothetical protein